MLAPDLTHFDLPYAAIVVTLIRACLPPSHTRVKTKARAWIYGDLCESDDETIRLQDRYSVRCAPHVIGVARDALTWMRRDIENELNSANDNPLIDGDAELLLHGGHFYGGHIAFAMDALKTAGRQPGWT